MPPRSREPEEWLSHMTQPLPGARLSRGNLLLPRKWPASATGFLFILPALVMYLTFHLYPFLGTFYLSLTDWDGAQKVRPFVGLKNYIDLMHDKLVWVALSHNLIWVVIGTITPIAVGLFLAMLLSSRPKGFMVFRTVYFMPQVLATVIVGTIWNWLYHPINGTLNLALKAVGLESLARGWLGDTKTALMAVLAAAIWAALGFYFVILLAGLQGIDTDVQDAAKIDGCNAWQRFRHVTIPQLSNVLTLTIVLALIGGFKVFDIVFVMTGGGPANATELIATYTYTKAFFEGNVSYAATLSVVMTVISLIASVATLKLRERGNG